MSNTRRRPETSVDIETAFRQRTMIHDAIREASQQAIRAHQLAGQPLVVWRNGRTVWLDPHTLEPVSAPPHPVAPL